MGEREVAGVVSVAPTRSSIMNPRSIRKAVIPAAGRGTRMLPFTKAVPKEMLPISNRPLIQYAVDEAVQSGIEEIILVTSLARETLWNYFRRDLALEQMLKQMGRGEDAERIASLSGDAEIRFVPQPAPMGLGDAIACAKDAVDGEPFAVILPDAIILGDVPCLREMMACYQDLPASYVATREVKIEELNRFGILDLQPGKASAREKPPYRVRGVVEKPSPEQAPTRWGIFGRYLLENEIFAFLAEVKADSKGEIQLSEALAAYCRRHALYAVPFSGEHFDAGCRIGYLQATIKTGLNDSATGQQLREFLSAVLPASEVCNIA